MRSKRPGRDLLGELGLRQCDVGKRARRRGPASSARAEKSIAVTCSRSAAPAGGEDADRAADLQCAGVGPSPSAASVCAYLAALVGAGPVVPRVVVGRVEPFEASAENASRATGPLTARPLGQRGAAQRHQLGVQAVLQKEQIEVAPGAVEVAPAISGPRATRAPGASAIRRRGVNDGGAAATTRPRRLAAGAARRAAAACLSSQRSMVPSSTRIDPSRPRRRSSAPRSSTRAVRATIASASPPRSPRCEPRRARTRARGPARQDRRAAPAPARRRTCTR